MSRNIKFILLFVFAFFVIGCEKEQPKQDKQKQSKPPMEVSIYTAKSDNIPISFEFPARITSKQDVMVVAKVSGTLQEQYFKAGDKVKKGDKLFLIEPDKYEAAKLSAQASLEVANADFKRAELEYNRAKNLKNNNAISQKEFDAAISTYGITKAQIQSAKANLKNADIDLSYTEVRAPFDGILGDPLVDVGSYVNLSSANLVRLTKLNPIDVDFAISEIDSLNINQNLDSKQWQQVGNKANLKVGDNIYSGKVTFIDKVVDNKTGTISAKAEFDNNQSNLLPGSYGRIKMEGFYEKNGYKIPSIALQQDEIGPYVYIIKEDKVSKSYVKMVSQNSNEVIIRDGLNDGDKIIIDNFKKISVGASVVEAKENK
ncbi:MAG: efflux RND transporter periplasmic adaptor subunit [Campylobacter sputorum]|uniref:efflux RND transporter periplasmic adaptor subunit n=1 Tax=Campylobacter sputorum TaxID=206 RepID=UPI000B76E436|nr:efflux RND transporter periplasmic adaptor subunit [Campylobacter sputorum]ASM37805.1 multidrug efflux system CmeABC, periplasmic fusion protein CmeA [Campylobacter sputorum bv. paraureolyticus LMG 11764]MDY6119896.1 efflux RND transporter periplasmic adaptor subunit [Campylobacter sputorum]